VTDQILSWHAANLTVGERRGKRIAERVHYGVTTAARVRVPGILCAVVGALLTAGCFMHRRAPQPALPLGPLERAPTPVTINGSDVYRRAGYLVATGEIAFVAAVHAFAGQTADSTRIVIALSFPNRDLEFVRDGEQYRAAYDVSYGVRSGNTLVARRTAHSEVRVASFRETPRTEGSVVVQQPLILPPGSYTLDLSVHDAGSTNTGIVSSAFVLPAFPAGVDVLSAVAVYQVTPRRARSEIPALIVNPRGTVTLGGDSTLDVYIENTGAAPSPRVRVEVAADSGTAVLYADTVELSSANGMSSGTAHLPVDRMGLGTLTIRVSDARGARAAPVSAVVRPADGLAVGTFREMLDYLRYFTAEPRLRALRASEPAGLAAAWSRFVRTTDPDPSTAENEALVRYFRRLEQANERFGAGDAAGWTTARGRVFAAFGPPDATEDPSPERADKPGSRLVWTYRDPALRVVFVDRTGRGDWQLDPLSAAAFTAALGRLTWCGGCG
jgi:GWxTD domain-containing protein